MQSQESRETSSTPPCVDEGLCSIPVNSGFNSVDDSDLVDTTGLPPGFVHVQNRTLINGTASPNGARGILIKPNGSYNTTCGPGSACERLINGLDLND